MSTEDNLKEAFAGESQANRRYLVYAKKAEGEGYLAVAKLFRAAAEGETIHAHNHLEVMGEVEETAENIKNSISGEMHENEVMYPEFIKQAELDKDREAARTFSWANNVERIHAELLSKALRNLEQFTDNDYYVCGGCGYPAAGETPQTCPNCGAPRKMFSKVE